MLAVTAYTKDYIGECRANIRAQLAAYDKLVAAAPAKSERIVEAFDRHFFNNLVLVLDHFFMHRARAQEGKDGNPANEVRLLCNAIMTGGNTMGADKTIKFDPAKSVTKFKMGDAVALDKKSFLALSNAFFDEIQKKFS